MGTWLVRVLREPWPAHHGTNGFHKTQFENLGLVHVDTSFPFGSKTRKVSSGRVALEYLKASNLVQQCLPKLIRGIISIGVASQYLKKVL